MTSLYQLRQRMASEKNISETKYRKIPLSCFFAASLIYFQALFEAFNRFLR